LGFSIFFGITVITLILWQLKLSYRLLFLEKMPWINLFAQPHRFYQPSVRQALNDKYILDG